MMGDAAERRAIDFATYLTIERDTDQRHEWFDGNVYAMAGGTLEHGMLIAATTGELLRIAAACGCRVLSSDVKVRIRATGLVTYPDVSVVCGPIERDADLKHALVNPAVLVEVLSDSTEAYDRGEKFEHYRHLASLRDYVIVSQHKPHIEVYSRDAQNRWVLTEAGVGEHAPLSAMNGAIDVDRVYAGVELSPAPPRPVEA